MHWGEGVTPWGWGLRWGQGSPCGAGNRVTPWGWGQGHPKGLPHGPPNRSGGPAQPVLPTAGCQPIPTQREWLSTNPLLLPSPALWPIPALPEVFKRLPGGKYPVSAAVAVCQCGALLLCAAGPGKAPKAAELLLVEKPVLTQKGLLLGAAAPAPGRLLLGPGWVRPWLGKACGHAGMGQVSVAASAMSVSAFTS